MRRVLRILQGVACVNGKVEGVVGRRLVFQSLQGLVLGEVNVSGHAPYTVRYTCLLDNRPCLGESFFQVKLIA